MNSISQTTGSNSVYGVDGLTGATGLSPDALLEYCQSQLGGLDTEIKTSIKQQNLELQEREAAETAQGVLEQFGDNGPTQPEDMQRCVDALNKAIDSLPQGDPVAAQLQHFEDGMVKQYDFHSATPMSGIQGLAHSAASVFGVTTGSSSATASNGSGPTAFEPTMGKPPQNDEWKGTCDALGTIVGDIKSNAEIQMLSLQDLVSQRQQAVSLACSMMSKEDSSLEQLSHLGQQ